jgi:hypothetical protein
MRFWIAMGFAVMALGSAEGCASVPAAEVGFYNAPSLNRRRVPSDVGHDVVANGRDSCERIWSEEKDPVPYRALPCGEAEPTFHSRASSEIRSVPTRTKAFPSGL